MHVMMMARSTQHAARSTQWRTQLLHSLAMIDQARRWVCCHDKQLFNPSDFPTEVSEIAIAHAGGGDIGDPLAVVAVADRLVGGLAGGTMRLVGSPQHPRPHSPRSGRPGVSGSQHGHGHGAAHDQRPSTPDTEWRNIPESVRSAAGTRSSPGEPTLAISATISPPPRSSEPEPEPELEQAGQWMMDSR